jgi:hypothetical protein
MDGFALLRFPVVRNDGPASTNGLTPRNANLYFASTGNSHVTTVAGETLLSVPLGSIPAKV